MKMLPARSNAAFRPSRAGKARRVVIPSVIAATVGAKIAPATAIRMSAVRTIGKVGAHAMATALIARAQVPPIMSPRLKCVASISAPIGVCRVMPMSPLTVNTAPIVA